MGSPWSTTDDGIFFDALHQLTAAGHLSPHDALWARLDSAIACLDADAKRLGMQACQTLLTLETLREIYDPENPLSDGPADGHDHLADWSFETPQARRQRQAMHLAVEQKEFIAEIAMILRDSLDELQPFAIQQLMSLRSHHDDYTGVLEKVKDYGKAPLDDFAALILVSLAQSIPRYAKFAGFVAMMALADLQSDWIDENDPATFHDDGDKSSDPLSGYRPTRLGTIHEVDENVESYPPSPTSTQEHSSSEDVTKSQGPSSQGERAAPLQDHDDHTAAIPHQPHTLSPVIELDERETLFVPLPSVFYEISAASAQQIQIDAATDKDSLDEVIHVHVIDQIQSMQWPTLTGRNPKWAGQTIPPPPPLSLASSSSSDLTNGSGISPKHKRNKRPSSTQSRISTVGSELSLSDLFDYLSISDLSASNSADTSGALVYGVRLLRRCQGYDDLRRELNAGLSNLEPHPL